MASVFNGEDDTDLTDIPKLQRTCKYLCGNGSENELEVTLSGY